MRFLSIAVIAVMVNMLLFSTIEYMVGGKRVRLADVNDVDIANFIRVDEQQAEVRSRREPTAPAKPEQDMRQNIQRLAQASGTAGGQLGFAVPEFDIDIGPAMGGDIRIAREISPLVRVPPDYPPRALSKKIEGYVLLRFTVTETGAVEDPEVLRASPAGLFEHAAKRAVLRWKYQPQIRDGQPTRVISITKVTFVIGDKDED